MKQPGRLLAVCICLFFCSALFTSSEASPATSYTMALNAKGRLVRTQDAYLPERTIIELNLNKPEDLFFDFNDYMYIADTGNRRILKYNPKTDTVLLTITHSGFISPKGVFVSNDNILYVADSAAGKIFRFDVWGNYLDEIGKPDDPSFEGRPFNPAKVGVDLGGNIYVYSQGIAEGIIQLSNTGEFLGFFTSNRVELTLTERILDLVFTEAQKAKLYQRTPPIFSNVYVGPDGLVYTTSMNSTSAVKRHNIAGVTQLTSVFSPIDPTDVYVNHQGIIFVSTDSGVIYVYSRDGEYIFSFGARNFSTTQKDDVAGLFTSLSALALDSEGNVWALDDEQAFIQSFTPTEYALKVYEALDLYNKRHYNEAVSVWQQVLRLNQMSVLAHNNIGKSYLSLQDYDKSIYHFEIAANRKDFSEAFWEVRNAALQKRLGPLFGVLAALIVLVQILRLIERTWPFKHKIAVPFRRFAEIKIVNDLLYVFRVLRHPIDSFYEIKQNQQGSLLGAVILFFALFFIYLWYLVGKGFIYQFTAVEDIDFYSIVLGFFALSILFVVSNWLVSSIHDGEGGLADIFKMFVYSLGPMFIAFTSVTLLSHVLTYNESFFLDAILSVAYPWTGLNIVLGVQETHNYSTKNALKSIVITFALMLVIVVVLIMVIVMWEQLYNFLEAIVREAIRNATS